jgi:uncharacterized membrane protein YjjP (DUF1212 family)
MNYNTLLDMVTDLGYELAMAGAETFRVEESISRCLAAYGIQAEVFAIPNYLVVSITTQDGHPITRMRRIGHHGNDLDAVEKFSGLSRAFCNRRPDPKEGQQWLAHVRSIRQYYSMRMQYVGNFLGAFGYALFFGGSLIDALCGGLCGMLVGFVNKFLDDRKANPFFRTIATSYVMALAAYAMNAAGICPNPDAATIGALMILVPGLLFTNAMRDIIYGDTNSGVNRIVQVFLIAAALALGTAAAWSTAATLWGEPLDVYSLNHGFWLQSISGAVGSVGFAILFNIHGSGLFAAFLGGALTWMVYLVVEYLGYGVIAANFWASLFAGFFAEFMARLRKKPAIGYLVVSIFPLLPGAGVYYTMNYAVRRQMDMFAATGMRTAAIAGIMAVGILLASTAVRIQSVWKAQRK